MLQSGPGAVETCNAGARRCAQSRLVSVLNGGRRKRAVSHAFGGMKGESRSLPEKLSWRSSPVLPGPARAPHGTRLNVAGKLICIRRVARRKRSGWRARAARFGSLSRKLPRKLVAATLRTPAVPPVRPGISEHHSIENQWTLRAHVEVELYSHRVGGAHQRRLLRWRKMGRR